MIIKHSLKNVLENHIERIERSKHKIGKLNIRNSTNTKECKQLTIKPISISNNTTVLKMAIYVIIATIVVVHNSLPSLLNSQLEIIYLKQKQLSTIIFICPVITRGLTEQF